MRKLLRIRRPGDEGMAMLTVILIMAVLGALGATVATVSINNLRNTNRDRQSGSALGAADAGVAQAIEYLRSNGVGSLKCPDATPSSCGSMTGWNNPSAPKLIALDSAGTGCTTNNNCAKVWIGVVQAYAPPSVKAGTYNIHSEGLYGGGPSARTIVDTVQVSPDKFPIGVYGDRLDGNGGTSIQTESLFSRACVYPIWSGNGNGTRFAGIDAYYGQPAAAHTLDHISETVGCGSAIESSAPTTSASAAHCPTKTAEDLHQSGDGGLVSAAAGASCYHQYQRPDGSWYPDAACPSGVTPTETNGLCASTAFTVTDLQRYGYRPRGLSDSQYAGLKARAQGQNLYNIATGSVGTAMATALAAGINDPVLYWDCSAAASNCGSGSTVSLAYNDFPANTFAYPPQAGACPDPYPIVTVVVEHGNLVFQGGNSTWFDGAFFVPDGTFSGNGGYNIVGTLFSNDLNMGGNQNWQLDTCWVTSFPGAVISVTQVGFREDDTKDAP
jgi:Tfp pilus assembly protein PilX